MPSIPPRLVRPSGPTWSRVGGGSVVRLFVFGILLLPAPGTQAQTAPEREISCGETVADTTVGLMNTLTNHCGFVLDQGEVLHPFDHPGGTVGVDFQADALQTLVTLYDEGLTECIEQGRGFAAPDLPAMRYVLVVDGWNPGGSAYTLRLTCDARVDPASARDLSCGVTLAGDSTGRPSAVDAHHCSSQLLTGGEELFRFDNPVEQQLRLRLLNAQPGQRILVFDDDGACLRADAEGFSCRRRAPGTLWLVVDGEEGSDGPFEIELSCSQVVAGTDLRVTGIDLSGARGVCDVEGVVGSIEVRVANSGDTAASGPSSVLLFEDRPPLDDVLGPSDALLGSADLPAIAAGQSVQVPIAVDATLRFRDAPLHALVDPDGLVPEADESNNTWDTTRACSFRPASNTLSPEVEWHWQGSSVMPDMVEVDTTPMVADPDGDGRPEVIVVTGRDEFAEGVVRVLRGADGSEVWTAIDPLVYSSSNIAVGDIDVDVGLEIVAQGILPDGIAAAWLEAFDTDGSHLWTSAGTGFPTGGQGGGAMALADIDCDGLPEVVFGRNVYRGIDGARFWEFEPGGAVGSNGLAGPLSVPVDVDGDGILEVVAGRTCYRWNGVLGAGSRGEILWDRSLLSDGNVAVDQFDADDEPEIALVADGRLALLDGESGELKWQVGIPSGGGPLCTARSIFGGAPTIADFDGDCMPEIGVGGADWYTVFETDGTIKWKAPLDNCSSNRTASTVFDFDADGSTQVVHLDETNLHVFSGRTGETVISLPAASHTWLEMVTIADVDGDGNAEIVVPLNPCPDQPRCDEERQGLSGVQVTGDAEDSWVGTRALWNQHAYHVDNVLDDGRIAGAGGGPCPPRSWESHGTFRNQLLPSTGGTSPDLTVSILTSELVDLEGCQRAIDVTTRVGNAGSEASPDGIEVRIYRGDPDVGGVLPGERALSSLAPAELEDFIVRVPAPIAGAVELHAVVDDDGDAVPGGVLGRLSECREDNNRCSVLVVPERGDPGASPASVGAALRVRDHGPPGAATASATLDWSADEGAPRDLSGGEHYHLMVGDHPQDLVPIGAIEPLTELVHVDEAPRAASVPAVRFLRVVAVSGSEIPEE